MEVTYPGRDENPLEKSDDTSVKLTLYACPEPKWDYNAGTCRICGKIE